MWRQQHRVARRLLGLLDGSVEQSFSSAGRLANAALEDGSVAGKFVVGFRRFASAISLPEHEQLSMPALSPTMSQGNIVAWKKKEGDQIQPGDVYCEVETDKATIEWESQEEGYLAKILVGDGAQGIDVGTPVAVLVEEEGDIPAFANYTGGASAAISKETAPKESAPSSSSPSKASSYPVHEVMGMPALSPTMAEGTLLKWKKSEGDEVQAGDVLAEIETDKATMEWEAQEDGIVAKILVAEGTSNVEVGTPLFIQVEDADLIQAFATMTAADVGSSVETITAAPAPDMPPPAKSAPAMPASHDKPESAKDSSVPKSSAAAAQIHARIPSKGRVNASPYARKLAAEKGIDLATLQGSGPGGRIVADDVLSSPTGSGISMPAFTDTETTQIRRVIAQRLMESKQQIPHYYLTATCRVDNLSAIRKKLNATLAATESGKISMNDFIIKASAMALKQVPEANASWHGDFIRQYNKVDCSIAVQTSAGLMVPIVRDADTKGLAAIAADVKSLAARAREGKLTPEDYTGGTFTVSNLGMFGVNQFSAIINPPQACILAVGAAENKVIPGSNGGFEEGSFVTVTLSCDHRVIDGAVGARWLQSFKGFLEDPASMLL